jgi:hypothetical protein
MSQETNKGTGLFPISCSILLLGTVAAFMLWQFQSWDNVWLLAQFIFLVTVIGILVGLLWDGLLGKGKPRLSNLAGIVLLLLLLWASSTILDPYNSLARDRFTTGEKTVKMMSLFLVGFAVMLGRDLARRYIQREKK